MGELLAAADSVELSQWQLFFAAKAERDEEARRVAREDRAILGE